MRSGLLALLLLRSLAPGGCVLAPAGPLARVAPGFWRGPPGAVPLRSSGSGPAPALPNAWRPPVPPFCCPLPLRRVHPRLRPRRRPGPAAPLSHIALAPPGAPSFNGRLARPPVPQPTSYLLELDVASPARPAQYTAAYCDAKTVFRARPPYLFRSVRNGPELLWLARKPPFACKVVYIKPTPENGSRSRLKLFFPPFPGLHSCRPAALSQPPQPHKPPWTQPPWPPPWPGPCHPPGWRPPPFPFRGAPIHRHLYPRRHLNIHSHHYPFTHVTPSHSPYSLAHSAHSYSLPTHSLRDAVAPADIADSAHSFHIADHAETAHTPEYTETAAAYLSETASSTDFAYYTETAAATHLGPELTSQQASDSKHSHSGTTQTQHPSSRYSRPFAIKSIRTRPVSADSSPIQQPHPQPQPMTLSVPATIPAQPSPAVAQPATEPLVSQPEYVSAASHPVSDPRSPHQSPVAAPSESTHTDARVDAKLAQSPDTDAHFPSHPGHSAPVQTLSSADLGRLAASGFFDEVDPDDYAEEAVEAAPSSEPEPPSENAQRSPAPDPPAGDTSPPPPPAAPARADSEAQSDPKESASAAPTHSPDSSANDADNENDLIVAPPKVSADPAGESKKEPVQSASQAKVKPQPAPSGTAGGSVKSKVDPEHCSRPAKPSEPGTGGTASGSTGARGLGAKSKPPAPVQLVINKVESTEQFDCVEDANANTATFTAKPGFAFSLLKTQSGSGCGCLRKELCIWEAKVPEELAREAVVARAGSEPRHVRLALLGGQSLQLALVGGEWRQYGGDQLIPAALDLGLLRQFCARVEVSGDVRTYSPRPGFAFSAVLFGGPGAARVWAASGPDQWASRAVANAARAPASATKLSVLAGTGEFFHFFRKNDRWVAATADVVLNLSVSASTFEFVCKPDGNTRTYLTRLDFRFQSVRDGKNTVWAAQDSDCCTRVVASPDTVTFHLADSNKVFKRGSDGHWALQS